MIKRIISIIIMLLIVSSVLIVKVYAVTKNIEELNLPEETIANEQIETNEPNIKYSTYIQSIGWQEWKQNEEISGTSGKGLRLEGIKIQLENMDNVEIKYQVHIQNVGWQQWKKNGDIAGIPNNGLRLEALRIKVENSYEFEFVYRVHIQNIGWQEWKKDGEVAGTSGKGLRIEAVQIGIIKKVPKAKLCIDTHQNIVTNSPSEVKVVGWKMTNISGTIIQAYLDNNTNPINEENIIYKKRDDVISAIKDYGTAEQNKLPGFEINIPTDELEIGKHVVKISVCISSEQLITQNFYFEVTRNISIQYETHLQNIGWQEWKKDEDVAGTSGKSLRLEALKIKLQNMPNVSVKYQVHIQNIGWQEWKQDGEVAGTSGKSLRLEALKVKLENSNEYEVEYRVHVQNKGWQNWKEEGEIAGTYGEGLRLEAMQIRIRKKEPKINWCIDTPQNTVTNSPRQVKIVGWKMTNLNGTKMQVYIDNNTSSIDEKNIVYKRRDDVISAIKGYGTAEQNDLPGFEINIFTENLSVGKHIARVVVDLENRELVQKIITFEVTRDLSIEYSTHMQNIGWQEYVDNGSVSGAIGTGYRLEAIKINVYNNTDISGTIQYSTYVKNVGWQEYVENDEIAGTTGQNKNIEAIRINLTGELFDNYNIYYRTYLQGFGWLGWASNGENAGMQGDGYNIEAIQIILANKETTIDTSEKAYFIKPTISYQAHIQNIGWQDYITESNIAGTSGKSLRLEAIKIKIGETNLSGTIQSSAHVQDIGWMPFVGAEKLCGTEANGIRLEAIKIKLTGELEEYFDIYYRTHVEQLGWIAWAKNGEAAGTQGYGYRLEALQIKLVLKGDNAPGKRDGHFYNKVLERKSIEGVKLILGKICAGIDVSSHQGTINWSEIKGKSDFAIIRCGYGQDFTSQDDKMFEENIEGCIRNNIPVEVYLYSYADSIEKAGSEAEHVIRLCDKYKQYIRKIWYDVEDSSVFNQISQGNMSKQELELIVDTFANRLRSEGYDVGLYTYISALNNLFPDSIRNKYEIWIAHYPGDSQDVFEKLYNKYKLLFKIWQFTSSGTISGINGNVDMSIRF